MQRLQACSDCKVQTVVSPLYIIGNNQSKWYLNLNNFRNTHYQTLNSIKKKYNKIISPQLEGIQFMDEPVQITYIVYPPNKRLFDIANICSIIDKFFCDAVTEANKWKDDNYQQIPKVIYSFGSIDKINPRCEIHIEKIE